MFADRVRETTTSTGTGSITLSGSAPTGSVTFNAAVGTNEPFYYTIAGGAEWETGQGVLTSATTLVREFVYASSNANALVNFSAGTKDVFLSLPAEQVVSKGMNYALRMGLAGN